MTVKKIMALAAELCGRRDLSDYLNNVSAENLAEQERDAKTLLQCYNLTENEIALDYLPLRRTQKFESEGYISYTEFEKPPVEILSVRDASCRKQTFETDADGIKVPAGALTAEYSYRPAVKTGEEEAEFNAKGDGRLLALGTACEFALFSGMMQEAGLLDKRYRDALACACRERGGRLKMRRWI